MNPQFMTGGGAHPGFQPSSDGYQGPPPQHGYPGGMVSKQAMSPMPPMSGAPPASPGYGGQHGTPQQLSSPPRGPPAGQFPPQQPNQQQQGAGQFPQQPNQQQQAGQFPLQQPNQQQQAGQFPQQPNQQQRVGQFPPHQQQGQQPNQQQQAGQFSPQQPNQQQQTGQFPQQPNQQQQAGQFPPQQPNQQQPAGQFPQSPSQHQAGGKFPPQQQQSQLAPNQQQQQSGQYPTQQQQPGHLPQQQLAGQMASMSLNGHPQSPPPPQHPPMGVGLGGGVMSGPPLPQRPTQGSGQQNLPQQPAAAGSQSFVPPASGQQQRLPGQQPPGGSWPTPGQGPLSQPVQQQPVGLMSGPPPRPGQLPSATQQQSAMSGGGPMPSQMQATGYPRYPPGVLNGAPPGQQVNGFPDSTAPPPGGRPMPSRYPPMPEAQSGGPPGYIPSGPMGGGYPPQPSAYPSQPSAYPPTRPSGYHPPGGPTPSYPGSGGYPSEPHQQQPQQEARRLDPEHMPSPIQVVEEDQKTRSGIFYTNQRGQVPPLVTTDFIVQDQGNASPRYLRSTMYSVPITADMMKQTSVPFGLVLSPMADVLEEENPPPLVDFGELGPVRCIRCKAYMCPNMQFIDGGRRFQCLLCKATTDVPAEYFQHLDHTGQRVDKFERAELVLGTYDIIATKEYCRDNEYPKPPALVFVIDVSYNNVKSGLVSLLCSQMKSILQNLPKEDTQEKSPMRVGFITYNSSVHFYNVSPQLGQPQMLVVGDTQEMFMPLLDGFLVDPEESSSLIDALMAQIPAMFADTRETETILAPAIQAGLEALKASGCPGKLLVFHSSLPIAEAPGKLKNRDDRSLLGTDKEKTILSPQNTVYNNLGQDCVGSGVSVDLFITNNSYIDLATIGQVCRLTGGEVFKYTYFQADLDGERLITDVEKDISRLCAFDAIMRVRTSTGVRPTDFYGHFYMSNTTDIELASIDPDKGIALEIKHDDKLSEDEGVYIQVALLYTALSGQRRIRIINLVLKATSQMSDLYRTSELDTLINFLSKQSVFKLLEGSPKAVKDGLILRSAQILACYRKNCATPTSPGQLILPECMKLLPLYINSLLKSDAVSGGKDMTVDDRWFVMSAVLTMDVPSSLVYLYPRLYPLHEMEGDVLPPPIRCSADKMLDHGVYLLENGIYVFMWLGLGVSPDWLSSVFGVPSSLQVETDRNRLPILDNPLSERVRSAVASLLVSRHRTMRGLCVATLFCFCNGELTIVRQKDKMELVMKHFLVEDRGLDGSSSYVDFLCHLHKEIRNMLS